MENAKSIIRPYLRRHRTLRKVVCAIVRHKPQKVYSWDDVGKLTDEWSTQLPPFDAIIGIPRSGLLVADRIAVNLGLPLSVPELFINGTLWQTHTKQIGRIRLPLSVPELFINGTLWQTHTKQIGRIRRVLIVEDSVSVGDKLFSCRDMLKAAFPEMDFYTGALMRTNNCPVDYSFIDKWLATPNHLSVLDIP